MSSINTSASRIPASRAGVRRGPGMPFPGVGSGSVLGYCNDWGERTFTFTKNSQGGLEVAWMTGPQRDRSLSSTVP